jgi:hypothetical protein
VGQGVFARCDFPEDEVLGEVDGEIIDRADYSSDYCVDLGNNAVMEPAEPFRLLNHSCDPNCEFVLWRTRRQNGRRFSRVWVQTIRPIQPDEELTIDYGWPATAAIPCLCGSSRCRGWIVHPDELDAVLLKSSLPFSGSSVPQPHRA